MIIEIVEIISESIRLMSRYIILVENKLIMIMFHENVWVHHAVSV